MLEQVDELCKAVLSQVKCDLINSGFVPKVEISLWKPTKRLIWLGTLSIVKQVTRFICATMFNIHVSNKFFTKY
jgi:hypothetical protein